MPALSHISLEIPDGQLIGLIGHTGSGKSTLIQHLNGLLKADSGIIEYNGRNIYESGYPMTALRSKVGLVFQYPEHQLFEMTVEKDVEFGPANQGLQPVEVRDRAVSALKQVGLKEKYWNKSPFELSGGQKRRAAIAGVLAMEPEVLILDEPTAGLDPKGKTSILHHLREIHEERGITIILVSHCMEDVAAFCERVIVINDGTVAMDGTPKEVFRRHAELEKMGLSAPEVTYVCEDLKKAGIALPDGITTVEEARDAILAAYRSGSASGGNTEGTE